MTDRRLIGTWKSDRKKTFSDWRWLEPISEKKKKKFKSMFGFLEVRYTPKYQSMDLKGTKSRHAYRVLGKNRNSVVIALYDQPSKEEEFSVIHFEGDHFWIPIGINREWFKKQK
jgi:hypothetical protein